MEENTSINWKIVIPTVLNVLINLIISFSGFDLVWLYTAAAVIAGILLWEFHRYPDKQGKNELLPFLIAAVLFKIFGFVGALKYTELVGAEFVSMMLVLAAAALFYAVNGKYDISYNKDLFAALTVNIAAISLYHEGVLMYVILGIPNAFL